MDTSSADIRNQLTHIHDDRSGQIAVVVSIMIVVATIAVTLRLVTRWLIASPWRLDDYAIIAALILDYGLFTTQIIGVRYGLGKHAVAVDSDTMTQSLKVLMACELIYVTCLFAIKVSILALYYRLFHSHSRAFNIAVYIVAGLTVAGWLTAFFVFIFQCKPVVYAFNKSTDGHCLNYKDICVATSTINIFIDVVLLILPLPVVWHLRVSKWQKLAISGMFLLGGSVCVVSIVRIPILTAMSPTDITWTEYSAATWSLVEISIGIFSACLPVMRPLLRRFSSRFTTVEETHSMATNVSQCWTSREPTLQRGDSDHSDHSFSKQSAETGLVHPGDLCHVSGALPEVDTVVKTEVVGEKRAGSAAGPRGGVESWYCSET